MYGALADSPLFSGITMEDARACLECSGAQNRLHPRGGQIFGEDDPPVRLYVLLEGSVTVLRHSAGGRRAVIARIDRPGEIFGEVYVFLGRPGYGCSVEAESAARVLGIPCRFFYGTCEKNCSVHSRLIRNMLGIFARKAFFLSQRVALLSAGSLRRKLACLLLECRQADGSLHPDMNREQMAEYLGVTRPSLSRELAAMRAEGLLRIEGRSIHVPDAGALQDIYE